jgi:NO-binding membrane sensor protein with MHYT domain
MALDLIEREATLLGLDPYLVALSILVACFASYTALDRNTSSGFAALLKERNATIGHRFAVTCWWMTQSDANPSPV